MFTVENDVPKPHLPTGDRRGRGPKYPFRTMKVGDSFMTVDDPVKRVSNAANSYGQRHRKKFTCRTVEGGVRVWRIS